MVPILDDGCPELSLYTCDLKAKMPIVLFYVGWDNVEPAGI